MDDSVRAVAAWLMRPEHLLLAGIIAGLVEAARLAGFPRNLTALLAIALGLLGGLGYVVFFNGAGDPRSPPVGLALAEGLALGLMGSGVWGGVRDLSRVLLGIESPHGAPLQERRSRPAKPTPTIPKPYPPGSGPQE